MGAGFGNTARQGRQHDARGRSNERAGDAGASVVAEIVLVKSTRLHADQGLLLEHSIVLMAIGSSL